MQTRYVTIIMLGLVMQNLQCLAIELSEDCKEGQRLWENHKYIKALAHIQEMCDRVRTNPQARQHPQTALRLHAIAIQNTPDTLAEPMLQCAFDICNWSFDGDDLSVADFANSYGAVLCRLGKYREAVAPIQKALRIRRKCFVPEHPDIAITLGWLGQVYMKQNRYNEANICMSESLSILSKQGDGFRGRTILSLHNLAIINKALGNHRKGRALQKQALEAAMRDFPDSSITAVAIESEAINCIKKGDLKNAEDFYKKAFHLYQKQFGTDDPRALVRADGLAKLYLMQWRNAEAEHLCDIALASLDEPGWPVELRCDWHWFRSIAYMRTERLQMAVVDLKIAMDLAQHIRHNTPGIEVKQAERFSEYYKLHETMLTLQHLLSNPVEAFNAMESSRSQSFQDLTRLHGIDLLNGVPEETAKRLRQSESIARNRVASLQRQLYTFSQQSEKDRKRSSSTISRINNLLDEARQQLVYAWGDIKNVSPAYRLLDNESRESIALDVFCDHLQKSDVLAMEYLLGKEESYVLFYGKNADPTLLPIEINEGQSKLLEVKPGPLTAQKMEQILTNNKKTGLLQRICLDPDAIPENGKLDETTLKQLAVLWKVLVPDEAIRNRLTTKGDIKSLLILPDGPLARLPFEMLVVEQDAFSPKYLLDLGPATMYAPSATVYYNLRNRQVAKAKGDILTVGNAKYQSQGNGEKQRGLAQRGILDELRTASQYSRLGNLSPLPWTKNEIHSIKNACTEKGLSVVLLEQDDANEPSVREKMAGRRIVHLACHGLADNEYGNLFGALALTPGDDADDLANDGFLTLNEMFGLDLKACELAILSACDTNLGPNQRGEGTWTICRGFLTSGAKRVVTTNWQVNDQASASLVYYFISDFISDLRQGESSFKQPNYAESLRQARLRIRRGTYINEDGKTRTNLRLQHPYYWAPFILMGPE